VFLAAARAPAAPSRAVAQSLQAYDKRKSKISILHTSRITSVFFFRYGMFFLVINASLE